MEFDGEFESVSAELLGVLAVLLGSEMGGDNKQGLLVPVARVVEFTFEVYRLADEEAECDAAAEGLVVVGCGAPLAGRRCWSCILNWSLRSSGKGINQSIR